MPATPKGVRLEGGMKGPHLLAVVLHLDDVLDGAVQGRREEQPLLGGAGRGLLMDRPYQRVGAGLDITAGGGVGSPLRHSLYA